MEPNDGRLKTTDICEIIRAAAASGVSKLQFGDLSIEFGGVRQALESTMPEIGAREAEIMAPTPEQKAEIDRLRAEEDLEQLKLTDPLKYEQMLALGELEDVQDEQDDRGSE